jgi:hypothetical protein
MEWSNLFQYIATFAISSGLIAWIIRSIINSFLKRDIENYKNKLMESQIRFTKLHEERATVIRDLYYKLVELDDNLKSLICPLQLAGDINLKKKFKKSTKAGNNFLDFSHKNRIYFNNEINDIIDKINSLMKRAFYDFRSAQEMDELSKQVSSRKEGSWINKEKMEKWNKAWDTITLEIPKLKEQLEKEFREILGVK